MTFGLTAENLKALRNADDIVFRYRNVPGEDTRSTFIECIKDTDPGDGFGRRDIRVQIEVAGTRIRNFTASPWGDDKPQRREVASMDWVLSSTQHNDEWRTIVHHFLRKDDHLWVELFVSNDSENLRKAGLSCDELALIVERKAGNKIKTFSFKLDHSIYPTHSTGRHVNLIDPPTYELNI
jgi:hypothetical protein